jgi:hypothetical protein
MIPDCILEKEKNAAELEKRYKRNLMLSAISAVISILAFSKFKRRINK